MYVVRMWICEIRKYEIRMQKKNIKNKLMSEWTKIEHIPCHLCCSVFVRSFVAIASKRDEEETKKKNVNRSTHHIRFKTRNERRMSVWLSVVWIDALCSLHYAHIFHMNFSLFLTHIHTDAHDQTQVWTGFFSLLSSSSCAPIISIRMRLKHFRLHICACI